MSLYLLFFIWNTVNQMLFFFTLLIVYGTPTKHVERAISDWTNLEINSGAQVTWENKPMAYIHILVNVK